MKYDDIYTSLFYKIHRNGKLTLKLREPLDKNFGEDLRIDITGFMCDVEDYMEYFWDGIVYD